MWWAATVAFISMDQRSEQIDTQEFRERIIRAFADVPAPESLLINHECDECLELQRAFLGKSWREISSELTRKHFSDLSLFSPQAFHAFIPAYLLHSVENLDADDSVSEFTAYALLPGKLADKDEASATGGGSSSVSFPVNSSRCFLII